MLKEDSNGGLGSVCMKITEIPLYYNYDFRQFLGIKLDFYRSANHTTIRSL